MAKNKPSEHSEHHEHSEHSQERQIQEFQMAEQGLQNLLMQKQVFQLELVETENALEELKKSKGDTYKIVGSLMIKAEKPELEKELAKKQELLGIRINSIEKQEKELAEHMNTAREELLKKLK